MEQLNVKCNEFDSYRDNSDATNTANNEDFFFIGFQLSAGTVGESREGLRGARGDPLRWIVNARG